MLPITATMPKPLVKVGGPELIDFALDRLHEAGMESVVVNVHHFADMLEAHLRTRETPRIVISDERERALGNRRRREEGAAAAGQRSPFITFNSDSHLDRGREPEPEAPRRRLGPGADGHPDARGAVMPQASDIEGRGDFQSGRGRPSAPPRNRRQRPFRLCGRRHREAGARARHAGRRRSRPTLFYDRAIAQGPPLRLELDGQWLHVGEPQAIAEAEACLAAGVR